MRRTVRGRLFQRGLLVAVCASVVGAAPAAAQDAHRWSLGLGTDIFNLNLSTREPGVEAQGLGTFTREWYRPKSQFGLRAQLLAGKDFPRGMRFTGTGCPTGNERGCQVNYSRSFAGVTGAITYQWRRESKLRPYVLAGPGVYVERLGASAESGFLIPAAYLPESRTRWSVGAMGGAGLAFRVGRSELFAEQAVHFTELSRGAGNRLNPLTFGIRF